MVFSGATVVKGEFGSPSSLDKTSYIADSLSISRRCIICVQH